MTDIAFEAFVAARSRALLRTAFGLTGDYQRAEDLLQTALLKVYPKWRRIENPEPYVRQTLVRTYASWWQRRWRHEISTAVVPDRMDPTTMSEPEINAALLEALKHLAPGQRAVIILRYLDDCSDQEIARMLQISVGTVRSQLSRALANLRQANPLADYATQESQ